PAPRKGTPVMIPPPDFDPFGISGTTPTTDGPAAPPAGGAQAPDPFGTTIAAEPKPDPFGTTVAAQGPAVPPPPSAPPLIPARPAPAATPTAAPATDAAAAPAPRKGTPVMIPPPDFDPFGISGTTPTTDGPEAEADTADDAAPEHRPFG
ncbi:hypothetical protein ACFC1T_08660, partial [Kitasatospora sp. NPDC056076]